MTIGRRDFITLLGGAAAWPVAARAQQADPMRRIGVLMNSAGTERSYVVEFVEALRKLGWIDGQNFHIEQRWHDNDVERARVYAVELVALAPDVILTATTSSLTAMQRATRTIPIVFLQVSDPVAQGFVTNLAKPGGNITGFTAFEFSMGGKWLDLLKQIAPSLARVAFLFNPETPQSQFFLSSVEAAGPLLGVEIVAAPVHDATEIERAIDRISGQPNGGLIVPTDDFIGLHKTLVAELASRHRLPSIYSTPDYFRSGGLMYYGYVRAEQFRQEAVYVDRILKGANPGDLPIQAPTKFELTINLKTAKLLEIEVPMGLMLRADDLVE
jgi:putative tryptophan/tyrosine transport system substrate-binding protein